MKIKIEIPDFCSNGDERRFFEGLECISAVSGFKGVAADLILKLDRRRLSVSNVCELIALLYRYGVDLAPLAILADEVNKSWIKDVDNYWYEKMF